MQEERMLVLQMLEDGKITAQEAAELLKALGGPVLSDDDEGHDFEQTIEKMAEQAGDFGERISETMEKKAHQLAEELEREGEKPDGHLSGWLGKLSQGGLAGLLGLAGGPEHQFVESKEGEFRSSGPLTVDLSTFNGSIVIQGSEDVSAYKLCLIKRIRHEDEDKAREIANALMFDIEQGADHLRVKPAGQRWHGQVSASLHLTLPRGLRYALTLNSYNGRIEVQDVEAADVVAKTANGRIQAERISAQAMTLKTANGRIEVEGSCQTLQAQTSNGRIVFRPGPRGGEYRLKTSNGSITALLPAESECVYHVEASTHNAKIKADLPELEFSVDERSNGGRKRLVARSRDWETRDEKVSIYAETTNGRVFIGREEGEGK